MEEGGLDHVGASAARREESDEEGSVERMFTCPISLELMKDPVILSTGISYERASIVQWFREGHTTCPVTNQAVLPTADHLLPNIVLRNLIEQQAILVSTSNLLQSASRRSCCLQIGGASQPRADGCGHGHGHDRLLGQYLRRGSALDKEALKLSFIRSPKLLPDVSVALADPDLQVRINYLSLLQELCLEQSRFGARLCATTPGAIVEKLLAVLSPCFSAHPASPLGYGFLAATLDALIALCSSDDQLRTRAIELGSLPILAQLLHSTGERIAASSSSPSYDLLQVVAKAVEFADVLIIVVLASPKLRGRLPISGAQYPAKSNKQAIEALVAALGNILVMGGGGSAPRHAIQHSLNVLLKCFQHFNTVYDLPAIRAQITTKLLLLLQSHHCAAATRAPRHYTPYDEDDDRRSSLQIKAAARQLLRSLCSDSLNNSTTVRDKKSKRAFNYTSIPRVYSPASSSSSSSTSTIKSAA